MIATPGASRAAFPWAARKRGVMAGEVLVAGLGIVAEKVRYSREDRDPVEGRFPAEALVKMGLVNPDRVLVVTTREAWDRHGKDLRERLGEAGVGSVPAVLVSPDQAPETLGAVYREIRDALETHAAGAGVVLDLAGGMRHISLLVYWATLVLDAEGVLSLDGAWYAGVTGGAAGKAAAGSGDQPAAPERQERVAQLTGLSSLLFLANWQAGCRAFRELGTLRPLQAVLGRRRKALFSGKQNELGRRLNAIETPLRELATALEQARPLDVGEHARRFLEEARKLAGMEDDLRGSFAPGLDRIGRLLERDLEELALPADVPRFERGSDTPPPLDRNELERELKLCEWYADHERPMSALLALREWMVNAVIHAISRGDPVPTWARRLGKTAGEIRRSWLNYHRVREPVAGRLGRLANRGAWKGEGVTVPEEVGAIADLWQRVGHWRNVLAHSAFNVEKIPNTASMKRVLGEITRGLRDLLPREAAGPGDPWRLEVPGQEGTVVIQPVGHSLGVLATTVRDLAPDRLVVICSRETRPGAENILRRISGPVPPVSWFEPEDPFHCHDDATLARAREAVGLLLANAEQVVAVLTGGTSSMVALVDRLRADAERVGTLARRCILVDPRPQEEQQADPVAGGEVIFLENGRTGRAEG